MFRFTLGFGRYREARRRGTGPTTRVRRRNQQLNCETLESRQLLSGYYIVNESSGKVLDDPGGSTAKGLVQEQFQLNGGANQRWDLVAVGNGNVKILNVQSGQVLGDPLSHGRRSAIQYPWNGAPNEQWKIHSLGNGYSEIVNANSNLALTNPNSSSNGQEMFLLQYNGGANQQWGLLEAGSAPAVTHYVQNASSKLVLDDPNSSTSNGTGIIQYHRDGGANQNWTFVPLANGNDVIVNQSSGLVLGDPGFSRNKGCGIIQWQLNVGLSEQWQVHEQRNGTYEILNAYSKLVLEDPRSSTSEGIQMDQWTWNGTSNQEWYLKPV
jgi:hypothetical protein